nr:armadillo repeat-containing protein 7-like isoform X3 [Lytechinus pictus]
MFQSRDRLEARTPLQHGIGRLQHLQNLMIEFQQTEDDDTLTEPSERLVEFGIGGLCNLVLDKENKAHILANDGVSMVKDCLSSPNEEIVLSAITTLMYLMTPASKQEITAPSIIECMQRFAGSSSKRLSNLANVFLQDYCTPEQRLMAESPSLTTGSVVGIPLPPEPKQETR